MSQPGLDVGGQPRAEERDRLVGGPYFQGARQEELGPHGGSLPGGGVTAGGRTSRLPCDKESQLWVWRRVAGAGVPLVAPGERGGRNRLPDR